MRIAWTIVLAALYSTTLMAQDTDAKLRSELQTMHTEWFKAFDGGDGATMDKMEVEKLILVMPTGFIWTKSEPRADKQQKHSPTERTLSDVAVRQFGDTAILTGVLTSKSADDKSQEATTVVFVRSDGKWKIASAQWSPVTNQK